MSVEHDVPEPSNKDPKLSPSEAAWYFSRWAVGGILQILATAGVVFLTMLAFMLFKNAEASAFVTIPASLAVLAAGMAGVQWIKVQWILHMLPEVLGNIEKNK